MLLCKLPAMMARATRIWLCPLSLRRVTETQIMLIGPRRLSIPFSFLIATMWKLHSAFSTTSRHRKFSEFVAFVMSSSR
ncbi:hypothetical protein BDV30DRAFT_202694 [Aspergillus minisclerotigenes]|uniref:Uncharacterized protein n=1 Tax=Aspergillus minisclerotigenes TaxID=656917 RepID=A0A5N6JM56_9EURO|nr:hypothetical protein BDV30DRAFT_202694 [Aspergillus minisclerotigenes]